MPPAPAKPTRVLPLLCCRTQQASRRGTSPYTPASAQAHTNTLGSRLHMPASQAFRTWLALGVSETPMLSYGYLCATSRRQQHGKERSRHARTTRAAHVCGAVFSPPWALLRSPHYLGAGRGGGEGCRSISQRGSRAGSLLPVSLAEGFARLGRILVCKVKVNRSVGAPGTPRFLPPFPAKPPHSSSARKPPQILCHSHTITPNLKSLRLIYGVFRSATCWGDISLFPCLNKPIN